MDIISTAAALVVILLALLTTSTISKTLVPPAMHGRFLTIDGLRGYLAVFVFLHHSYIWFQYIKTGAWSAPASQLFVHLGQGGVALFFMITGFLFFSKILDSRGTGVDWVRLYVSRFLRLTPLYIFSMLLLFGVVAAVTYGQPVEPIQKTAIDTLKWLGFTIFGSPDLNGLDKTIIVNAGVTWSLPYEWFFYVSLPVLALLVGMKVPKVTLLISSICAVAFGMYYLQEEYQWLFLGGIAAAVFVRAERFTTFAKGRLASWMICILLIYIVVRYPYLYTKTKPTYMLVVVFCLIAGGNTLFGLLSNRISRALGEMAYSIYLLHGLFLYVLFKFILGFSIAMEFSAIQHWLSIAFITPIMIIVCGLTFRFIEKPAMRYTEVLAARLTGSTQSRSIQRDAIRSDSPTR
ncbi:acyltransferase family protein [Pseudomonas veronii]|uniref:acyltransferase family protein n=1 Tax=Pseudomonas veronii TaxID=76761 RepID=UPI0009A4FDC2|nr:acyltransferase [Pseudomonas veronii]AQY66592.1 acyltransferase [Pseudomonas veronii]